MNKNIASLVCNLAVVVIALGCMFVGIVVDGEGASFFRWYTRLSNILAAIACAATLPYDLRALRGQRVCEVGAPPKLPRWLCTLKLAGVSTVMVTFLTVFLIMGFAVGHLTLLTSTNFFFHLVSPLIVLMTSCVFERIGLGLSRRAVLWPFGATVLYALLYFVMVIALGPENGGWVDFYGFNTGGIWPLSIVVMLSATMLISLGCWKVAGGKRQAG